MVSLSTDYYFWIFPNLEILRISINDLKAKISTTKILYLIQLDLNMLNVHMNKDNNSGKAILHLYF